MWEVVTHYGATRSIADHADFVAGMRVPTLIMVGGLDTYNYCCLAETARKLAAAAAARPGKPLLEVVEYREANHGWNLNFGWHGATAADSFKRTIAHLRAHAAE